MSHLQTLEPGSRHDLHIGMSPDAPDESLLKDETEGAFGYAHSDETSSRYDEPGVRVVLFVSGCLLRCIYCHNPDTWHLKDGTYVSTQQILDRLSGFASALRELGGGLTISGGEPLVQLAFTKRILAGPKRWASIPQLRLQASLATVSMNRIFRNSTLFFSTSRVQNQIPIAGLLVATLLQPCVSRNVLRRLESRPGSPLRSFQGSPMTLKTSKGSQNSLQPMKNVEWVEIQPFHQLGAFKWKAMNLDYRNANTPTPTPNLIARVIDQFRTAGCRVR